MGRLYCIWTIAIGCIFGAITPLNAQQPFKTDSLKKEKAAKTMHVAEKALEYLAFLNYSDRTEDRMRAGIDYFKRYSGKKIREINVQLLKPFGTSLDNPKVYNADKVERLLNKTQINIKLWVIKEELLFKSGDTVVPVLIADCERNLFDSGHFKDVKFVVQMVEGDSTTVDISVLVRDHFSWSPYLLVEYDMAKAGIQFNNLFGLPQYLLLYAGPVYRGDDPYIFAGEYSYKNIAKSHVDVNFNFVYRKLNKGLGLTVSRPFYSALAKWAGSAHTEFYRENARLGSPYVVAIPTKVAFSYNDVWLARSFPLAGSDPKSDLRRIVIAARATGIWYFQRPFLHNDDYALFFPAQWSAIAGIGLANWDYYLDRDIYLLGFAEYFAKGFNATLLFGPQYDESVNTRLYTGLNINHGIYFKRFGYWFSQLSMGYYNNRGNIEQITAGFQNNFFSAPVKMGHCNMRQFITANFNLGFLQSPGHDIVVNDNNGIRGLFYNGIRGNRSYTFSYQLNFYPTPKVLTLTSCLFAFADIAISGKDGWRDNQLVQAYGVGLKLRSLVLGIDYFELTFAWYPGLKLPNQGQYNFLPEIDNRYALKRNDLFTSGVLSPFAP